MTAVAPLFLAFAATLPFVSQPLIEIWAFIPIYESALTILDLVIVVILLTQFPILRSWALLVLACGYRR